MANCLICKGDPIKPFGCGTCKKQVCKMSSYEIYIINVLGAVQN